MKNWLQKNWFKLSILFIVLVIGGFFIFYLFEKNNLAEIRYREEQTQKLLEYSEKKALEYEETQKWKYYDEETIPQLNRSITGAEDIKNKANKKLGEFQSWIDEYKNSIESLKYYRSEISILIEQAEQYVEILRELITKSNGFISNKKSIIKAINERNESLVNNLIDLDDKLVDQYPLILEREKEEAIKSNALKDAVGKLLQ